MQRRAQAAVAAQGEGEGAAQGLDILKASKARPAGAGPARAAPPQDNGGAGLTADDCKALQESGLATVRRTRTLSEPRRQTSPL